MTQTQYNKLINVFNEWKESGRDCCWLNIIRHDTKAGEYDPYSYLELDDDFVRARQEAWQKSAKAKENFVVRLASFMDCTPYQAEKAISPNESLMGIIGKAWINKGFEITPPPGYRAPITKQPHYCVCKK